MFLAQRVEVAKPGRAGDRLVFIFFIFCYLKRLEVEGPAAAAVDLSPWCPAFNAHLIMNS